MSLKPNFERIAERFAKNFSSRDELGAAVSIWQGEKEIFSKQAGSISKTEDYMVWQADTLVPVWSASKGPAALTLLLALDQAGISPSAPVKQVWPELTAAADGKLSFIQLLAHQSGLPALDPDNRPHILQHSQVVAALEKQTPFWSPGTAHGYHPRTSGALLDEIVRKLSGGKTLGQLWREKVGQPLDIDIFLGGLGKSQIDRLATIYSPKVIKPASGEESFYRALGDPDSLSLWSFGSPSGLRGASEINKLESLQAGIPSLGGVASATGLAKFYAVLANGGYWMGVQAIPKAIIDLLNRPISDGDDLTLLIPSAFSAGFMMDPTHSRTGEKLRQHFGPSLKAFGQPGAGGSHAFADPENQISFAYVMNQMQSGILPNAKSLGLVEGLYS